MEVYTDLPGVHLYSGNYLGISGKDGVYYAFCHDLKMAVENVDVVKAVEGDDAKSFALDKKVKKISWLDNGESLAFTQVNGEVQMECKPYLYGTQLVVRVAKIEVES